MHACPFPATIPHLVEPSSEDLQRLLHARARSRPRSGARSTRGARERGSGRLPGRRLAPERGERGGGPGGHPLFYQPGARSPSAAPAATQPSPAGGGRPPAPLPDAHQPLRRRLSAWADALDSGRRYPVREPRGGAVSRAEPRLGHRLIHDAGGDGWRLDALAATLRKHPGRGVHRRGRGRHAIRSSGGRRWRSGRHVRARARRPPPRRSP